MESIKRPGLFRLKNIVCSDGDGNEDKGLRRACQIVSELVREEQRQGQPAQAAE